MANERFPIRVEGSGEAFGHAEERVLVTLERAQGAGSLKNLPVRLPVGCRRGGCGVCRVRVTEGDYRSDKMSRAHVSEADEASGLTLACCIYPLSPLSLRLEPAVTIKAPKQYCRKTESGGE